MSGRKARLPALPPTAVDIGLTTLALAGQAAPFVLTSRSDHAPWTVLEFAPILLVALPVLWRRRAPVTCLLVAAVGVAAYSLLGSSGPEQPVWYGALVLMHTVAERAPHRLRMLALVGSAVGIAVVGGVLGSVAVAVREAFLWGAAYALGRTAHLRRAYAQQLEDRAGRLERERETAAERAAERERAQIARDMHDVLAHSVSLMVVQAEAGPVVVRTDPDRAEAVFDAVAAAGRDAMVQLRRMLGLLADGEGPRSPQPTLDEVPAMVAAIGRHASLVTTGTSRAVPPDIGAAAYRIVQEALTNVVRHARADAVSVALDWRAAELVIRVTDDGIRGPRRGAPAGGRGLIGIRERAAACGGSATCGPLPGPRGFEVEVRLPA